MAEASQTLELQTRLFHDVFNASPIGIAVETLEGQPLFVNPAFCSMLGFSEEELRNKHCADFSPPEDAEKDWALFQKLRAGAIDHYQLEKQYFRRDGSLMWGRLSISLLKNSSIPLVLAMVEDISDAKLAEEARFRHAAIVESSEDAIISKDLAAVITSWNSGAERMFGYKEQEVIGRPITILIPPELWEEENNILERLRAGGRIEHYETKRVTKTGKRIDVSLIIGPIKDSTGRLVGFTKMAHDITQRKRAEKAVKESEIRFRLVADTAPVLIWMSDEDKLCTYFNKPWLDFTGRTMEEELGNGWASGVHPEDLEGCINTYVQSFDRRKKFKMEYRLRRSDGEYRWILDIGVPRLNEDRSFAGYIGIGVDVTERKAAEDRLRELNRALEEQTKVLQSREELLKSFVKNVPAGVAMLDRDMRYLQVSDRWCADYSVDPSQILGRLHYDVFPDVPKRWEAAHRRALEGETLRADEDRWDREDGRTTWVRWEIRPWRASTGVIGGILILAEDITERKQMEEILSGMNRRIIESQESERRRIARELHDDINQRIAMLAIELDAFRQSVPELGTQARNRLEELFHATQDIGAEIQEISHSLHSSKLEYLGLVAACKGFCSEVADHHKVEIDFTTDNIPTTVPPDTALCLFRVLQESLNNAIKHSGAKRFEAHLSGTSGDIQLKIRDYGIGFDAASMMVSRGLGIVSMRERVKVANGTLFISSMPMAGTEIVVSVPAV